MLRGFTLILIFQLCGELLVELLAIAVPGPVIGMVLLLGYLLWRGSSPTLDQSANALLQHLSLLFIPAGVGVVLYLPVLAAEWPAISLSLLGGTLITIAVTGLVMRLMSGNEALKEDPPESEHLEKNS
ncbi:MAG: CidA/LrgA family protein [Gammaproteobacteria bacterium]